MNIVEDLFLTFFKVMFGYKKVKKTKLSPIMLIVVSAIVYRTHNESEYMKGIMVHRGEAL